MCDVRCAMGSIERRSAGRLFSQSEWTVDAWTGLEVFGSVCARLVAFVARSNSGVTRQPQLTRHVAVL